MSWIDHTIMTHRRWILAGGVSYRQAVDECEPHRCMAIPVLVIRLRWARRRDTRYPYARNSGSRYWAESAIIGFDQAVPSDGLSPNPSLTVGVPAWKIGLR